MTDDIIDIGNVYPNNIIMKGSNSHDDKYVWKFDKPDKWDLIGKVWVDSGQIAIADPCYLLSKEEYKETFIDNYKPQPHSFKRGIVESGHGGDGDFPVYVKKNEKGLVMEMKIIFNQKPMDCGCHNPDEVCDDTNRGNVKNE